MERPSPQPLCPRCGYDLGGMVASWTTSCPLQSTCSECGLTFNCDNILSPRLLGPGWSFEHTRRENLRRWIRTSLMVLRPAQLLAQFRVDHLVHLGRLIWFGLSWLILIHLAVSLTSLALRFGVAPVFGVSLRGSFGWSAHEIVLIVLRSLANPYSQQIVVPVGPGQWTTVEWFPAFMITLGPTLLMPLWMTILGTTFQEARVRRVHLVRGLVYTLPGAALGIALLIGGLLSSILFPASTPSLTAVVATVLIAAFPIYHSRWWYLFISRYLQIRHALATVLLMQFMSILVVLIWGALLVGRR